MPTHKAYYDLLQVPTDVDNTALKRQYRKLAVKYHPDKNGGSAEATDKFQKISRAYEVLSDPEKRKIYDQHGEKGVQDAEVGGTSMDASDLFASMFGGNNPFDSFFGHGRKQSKRSQKISRTKVKVDLKTIVCGGTVEVTYNNMVAKDISTGQICTDFVVCEECHGEGHITRVMQVGPGMFQQASGTCGKCESRGYDLSSEKSNDCIWVENIKTYSLKIPAGVSLTSPQVLPNKGQLYVVYGEHEQPNQVKRSDLHVELEYTSNESDEWQLHDPKLRHLQWTPKLQVIYGLVTNRLRCMHPNGQEYLLEMPKDNRTDIMIAPNLGLPAEEGSPNPENPYADTPRGDLIIKVLWDFDTTTLEKANWFQQMKQNMHTKAPWTNPTLYPTATECLTKAQYQTYMDNIRNAAASNAHYFHGGSSRQSGGPTECVQS